MLIVRKGGKVKLTMLKVIKVADIVLIVFLIVAGLCASFYLSKISADSGKAAVVSVDGKEYGTYSLAEDRTIDLDTGNVLKVEKGQICMDRATCRGHDCIHQGKISRPSQTIVCLPHKVIVEIKGGKGDFDSISK